MSHYFAIIIVIFCAVIESFAQISLKKSTISGKKWVVAGVFLFLLEAILYTFALQWLDVSTAYPIGALCFVIVTFLACWLLNETISLTRWFGIFLIVGGCALISL